MHPRGRFGVAPTLASEDDGELGNGSGERSTGEWESVREGGVDAAPGVGWRVPLETAAKEEGNRCRGA